MGVIRRIVVVMALGFVISPYDGGRTRWRVTTEVKTDGYTGASVALMLGGTMTSDRGGEVTSTAAAKGNRFLEINETSGQIVDFDQRRLYLLDVPQKQYRIVTFDELRSQLGAQAAAGATAESGRGAPALSDYDLSSETRETADRRPINGYDTHNVIITIDVHSRATAEGRTDFRLRTDLWLGKVAVIDDINSARQRLAKTVTSSPSQVNNQMGLSIGTPWLGPMLERLRAERQKIVGTPLLEIVSLEARPAGSEPTAAGRLMTRITTEILMVEPTVTDRDLALPAGFTQKK